MENNCGSKYRRRRKVRLLVGNKSNLRRDYETDQDKFTD